MNLCESMKEDVLAFVSVNVPHKEPWDVAIFRRVALTPDQITAHGLTTYPPKPTDLRSGRWTGRTCQLEALPPELLAGLLTDAIEAFLDARVLAGDREAETRERRQIARALPGADV